MSKDMTAKRKKLVAALDDLTDEQIKTLIFVVDELTKLNKVFENSNPNIYDADEEHKGKKVKLVEEDEPNEEEEIEEEMDEEEPDDEEPKKKGRKSPVIYHSDDEEEESEEEESENDEEVEEDEENGDDDSDFNIDTGDDEETDDEEEDEKPVRKSPKKSPTKVKKVKFDEDDFDTWTVDNIKKVEKFLKDYYEFNLNKTLGKEKGEKRIKLAFKLAKEMDKYIDSLGKKSLTVLTKEMSKAKLKVTGRTENDKRKNCVGELYSKYVKELGYK